MKAKKTRSTQTKQHSYRELRKRALAIGARFSASKARRATTFFNTQLYHVEGNKAGTLLHLERWEHKIIKRVFGWIYASTGYRVIREVYIEVARKNGKSFLASGFALYLLFADKEPGAQVVSAAADRDQAAIVYDVAKNMVLMNPTFARLVGTPYKRSMAVFSTASSYKVVSADADTKHGKNLSAFVCDELHVQPNRKLVDVLASSTSARKQPLAVYITTAGSDRLSICWEKHDYAMKVNAGIVDDPSFYGVIFGLEEKDDWKDERNWYKANPNLGISKELDYMRREFKKALVMPDYENTFKRLDLNIWTEQVQRWIPMEVWDNNTNTFDVSTLEKRYCYAGIDLSSTTDLCALALFFPDWEPYTRDDGTMGYRLGGKVLTEFWCPEEALSKRADQDRAPYVTWHRQGFLNVTPGGVVDYDFIRARIIELYKHYEIREIAMDPWNATSTATALANEGFNVVAFRQGFGSMSSPSKELSNILILKRLAHNAHPVLRWCASNVAVEINAVGDIKPSKKKSTERIDGIVALVMAIGRAMCFVGQDCIYDTQGVTIL